MIRLARYIQHLARFGWFLLWSSVALVAQSPAPTVSTSTRPVQLTQEISNARAAWTRDSREIAKLLETLKSKSGELTRREKEIAELRNELANLQNEKTTALEDMRAGAFCTGCGETRTALLSRGEPFPHPGQASRPATPEELLAAAKKYDEKIAKLRAKLNDLESRQKKGESDVGDTMHRLRVLMHTYHASILKEQELRQLDWAFEKERIENALEQLHASVKSANDAVASAKDSDTLDAAQLQQRILLGQLNDSLQRGTSAEARARQQAQSYVNAARTDMDRLAALAEGLPQKFGIPGGWFLSSTLKTPPRSVDYTVLSLRRFDTDGRGADSAKALLGDAVSRPKSRRHNSKPKSVKDLLEGK